MSVGFAIADGVPTSSLPEENFHHHLTPHVIRDGKGKCDKPRRGVRCSNKVTEELVWWYGTPPAIMCECVVSVSCCITVMGHLHRRHHTIISQYRDEL